MAEHFANGRMAIGKRVRLKRHSIASTFAETR